MRLIHKDGRKQTIPDGAYARHSVTYTRAGWSVDPEAVEDPDEVTAAVQDYLLAAPPLKATKAKQ